jgi:DNA modification methylase
MSEWRILRGDCLQHLPDIRADAIIADPPYGQNYRPGRTGPHRNHMRGIQIAQRHWEQIEGEDQSFDPSPFLGFPVVCLWGAQHYSDKLPAQSGWFIWDKRCGVPSNDQADCEMAWTNRNRAARIYRQVWNGIIREGEENIGISGSKLHPHQKPAALMMWCIEQLGLVAGQTVYDPYAGSGTTGVACLRLGLNFIGSEIDPEYAAVAERRLSQTARQIPLLVKAPGGEQFRFLP